MSKANKTVIITGEAPTPIGPYSQAVKYKDLVFVSGQIAIEAESGEMVTGGVKEQTKQIMENIRAILQAADSSFDKILHSTVYLRSMDYFTSVNDIFNEYLRGDHPARETVEVCRLPREADVEISVIAYANG